MMIQNEVLMNTHPQSNIATLTSDEIDAVNGGNFWLGVAVAAGVAGLLAYKVTRDAVYDNTYKEVYEEEMEKYGCE